MSKSKTYLYVGMISLLFIVGMFGMPSTSVGQESTDLEKRVENLARGINLTRWMWPSTGALSPLETRFDDEDFTLIKSLGFNHVRIPIDMPAVFDEDSDNLLNEDALPIMDEGFRKILSYDLALVVDLHSVSQREGSSNYSGALASDEEYVETFIQFWKSFAKHLKKFDPDKVFLEIMNEPVFRGNEEKWFPIQERLVKTIRSVAPKHTILVSGAQWANRVSLMQMEPLSDPNIVYKFHYYSPFFFTHQGATWSSDVVKPMRNVPYPSTPDNVKEAIEQLEDEGPKNALKRYGEERWNAKKMEEEIEEVADWASKHGLFLCCNEFGVYNRYSPPEDRTQWHHDLRIALEKYNIGWTKWEYDRGFGLVQHEEGKTVVDKSVAKALDLNVEE